MKKENDMHVFSEPNMDGFKCRICRTSAKAPVVLVPIPGTENGNIQQAEQIHKECLDLFQKMFALEQEQAGRDSE